MVNTLAITPTAPSLTDRFTKVESCVEGQAMTRDRRGTASKYDKTVDETIVSAHSIALDLTGTGRRVLELGCAAGHVSSALKARGHHVVGVEIDPESAERARSVADHVYTADLDFVDLPSVVTERDFDVVLIGDVLEHLRDPLTVLKEVGPLLAQSGFVVLSVPNVAFYDVRIALLEGTWQYYDDGLLDRGHLHFFTRATLFELAAEAGFVATELQRVEGLPGGSNVQPAAPVFVEAVRDLILLDPNSSTYQFVVKLEPRSADSEHRALALAATLDAADAEARERIRTLLSEHTRELAELHASRRQLLEIKSTKSFRLANGVRHLFRRLRARLRRA